MRRYAIEIAYDGTAFRGWQSQPGGGGIQDAAERALAALGECARVNGAGRTDAGVHARAQVAHFELARLWEPQRLTLALNSQLPSTVSVMRSAVVDDAFHARRSAQSREYRYFIWNAPTCYPHLRPYVLWLPGQHYDWRPVRRAARLFVGTHDFRAFCRREDCPENTIRTVYRASLKQTGNLLVFSVRANAYLTNMIRIMIGNLTSIAAGRADETWLASLLEGRADRRASAQTASPSGLFFWRVRYPETLDWA